MDNLFPYIYINIKKYPKYRKSFPISSNRKQEIDNLLFEDVITLKSTKLHFHGKNQLKHRKGVSPSDKEHFKLGKKLIPNILFTGMTFN